MGTIQMIIDKQNLDQFKKFDYLEIFTYANIYFIENEED